MHSIPIVGSKEIWIADSMLEKGVNLAMKAARSLAPVLIVGESGTGKELMARLIHSKGQRNASPFISINCAAIPDGLIESEFFGYERGAFTGAMTKKVGKFELAHGGSFLLDEISEMPFSLQAKLLRVLQEGEMDRLGGKFPIPVDVRVFATTNQDLQVLIQEQKFREDLFFRLNVIVIECPALRGRKEAIRNLLLKFLERARAKHQVGSIDITQSSIEMLCEYHWPGNIRELQNLVERAVVLWEGEALTPQYFSKFLLSPKNKIAAPNDSTLAELEQNHILKMLDGVGGHQAVAAEKLGITARTLRNKLKTYRLSQE